MLAETEPALIAEAGARANSGWTTALGNRINGRHARESGTQGGHHVHHWIAVPGLPPPLSRAFAKAGFSRE
jgi:hypothetical protein